MSEPFLSRWSRRKQEIAKAEASRPAPSEREPEAAAEPASHAAATEEAPALSAEEIAALPPIEEMSADSDITAFLRKGVPDLLRKAALRKAWALDPTIRDYVSEAREYAYDWNVPGGVPGNGPLLPTDDPQAMLERTFAGLRSPADAPEPAESEPQSRARDSDARGQAAVGAETREASDGADSAPVSAREAADPVRLSAATNAPSPEPAPEAPERPEKTPVRRHGGAMPD